MTYSIGYEKNFDVVHQSNKWQLKIKNPLNESTLEEKSPIVTNLEATEEGNNLTGSSVFLLELPKEKTEDKPEFSEPFYIVEYPKTESGIIEFEKPLIFRNVDDKVDVKIELNNYTENFDVIPDSGKWHLKIKKPLDDSILKDKLPLIASLVATEQGNDVKGSTVLVLELPKSDGDEDAPEFTENFYIVTYPKNGKGVIEFGNPLKFNNLDEKYDIKIELSAYSENFRFEKSSGNWQIQIQKPLNESVLKANNELVLTMIASGANFTKTGISILVLELPKDEVDSKAPEFSDVTYTADYPITGTGIIDFNQDVKFNKISDVSDISIEISDYNGITNFGIEYNVSLKKWQIQILIPLSKTVLDAMSFIDLTLAAKKKDIDGSGKATLIINLPPRTPTEEPKFSKGVYSATYQYISGIPSVTLIDEISITNKLDLNQISIVADEYSSNFDLISRYNTWFVNVKSPLDEAILKTRTNLAVSIKATDQSNGLSDFSVIEMKLPPVNSEDAPKFSKTFYTAEYTLPDGKGLVTLDEPLEIINRETADNIKL
ncbi:uncharacterized protein [Leptinotarsa decemlineata]|uniref:uncharacterized protein n=1 Tax=Leptinotarsa decemlineata TaxID=7539 RepID=UPI003D30A2CA